MKAAKIPFHPTLGQAFLFRCQTAAKKVGFRYKQNGRWIEVTFADQFEYIRNLSVGLMKLGLSKGDHLAVIGSTSILWGRVEFAALGAGAKLIPIYPTNTPEDVQYILNHAEARFVVCDSLQALEKVISVWGACAKLECALISFDIDPKQIPKERREKVRSLQTVYDAGLNAEQSLRARFEEELRAQAPDDVYTICYTSGTTGVPKGVMLSHRNMMSALNDTALVIEGMAWEGDSLLSFLPMSHIFGRFESYTPYALGFVQSFAENLDSIINNMQEVRPTLFLSVPRIFEKAYTKIMELGNQGSQAKKLVFAWAISTGQKWIAEKRATKANTASLITETQYQLARKLVFNKIQQRFGGKLRITLSGGAPLPDSIGDFMEMVGVPIYQGYGLTETCAPICVNTPKDCRPGTVGKLFPDVLVRIAEDGEVLVKSDKVFVGYYKNEEATAEALKDRWFYTGDIGHLDEDGYLKITDRKKDLIKTAGGKFVAPQRIENIAKTSTYLNQVVVYGDQKPYITALITLHQEPILQFAKQQKILSSEFSELIKHPKVCDLVATAVNDLNKQLPKWETIKRYHILPAEFTVEAGELTPSLKVKRKLLTKKYVDSLEALYN